MDDYPLAQNELAHLRAERDRLLKERDQYRADLEAYTSQAEAFVTARLQLLSHGLEKDIRERFFADLKRYLWAVALLAGVATLGGFWRLSDIVNQRIDNRVKEREGEFQKLRDAVIQEVVDFRLQSARAIEDVTKERETAKERIRSLQVVTFSAESTGATRTTVSVDDGSRAILGALPPHTLVVLGSKIGPGYEKDGRGVFSVQFQRALMSAISDTDGDGRISFGEAVASAGASMAQSNESQRPDVVGDSASAALFAVDAAAHHDRYRRAHALIIGVGAYRTSPLVGPVRDATEFRRVLASKMMLAAAGQITTVLDSQGTRATILRSLEGICRVSQSDDIVLVYYAGHVTTVPDVRRSAASAQVRALVPFDYENGSFILFPELTTALSKCAARQRVIVVDG